MRWWRHVAIRESIAQLIRFGVVGLSTNAIGYGIYLGLTYWGLGSKLTMTMLYSVGATAGFVGHRNWAFSDDGDAMSAGGRYFAVYGLGYLINLCALYLFVDRLGYHHAYVQAVSVFIVAAFLFVALKFIVFPQRIVGGRRPASLGAEEKDV